MCLLSVSSDCSMKLVSFFTWIRTALLPIEQQTSVLIITFTFGLHFSHFGPIFSLLFVLKKIFMWFCSSAHSEPSSIGSPSQVVLSDRYSQNFFTFEDSSEHKLS